MRSSRRRRRPRGRRRPPPGRAAAERLGDRVGQQPPADPAGTGQQHAGRQRIPRDGLRDARDYPSAADDFVERYRPFGILAQHRRGTTPGQRATTGASRPLVRPAPRDPARRVHQRIGDGGGPKVRGRRLLLAPAVPGPDQDAARGTRQRQHQADRTNATGQAAGRRRRLPTPAAPFARHRSAAVRSRVDACLQKEGTEPASRSVTSQGHALRFRRPPHGNLKRPATRRCEIEWRGRRDSNLRTSGGQAGVPTN